MNLESMDTSPFVNNCFKPLIDAFDSVIGSVTVWMTEKWMLGRGRRRNTAVSVYAGLSVKLFTLRLRTSWFRLSTHDDAKLKLDSKAR